MTPERAVRLLPIFIGAVAATIAAVALVAGDYQMAGVGGVLLVLAVVTGVVTRIRGRDDHSGA